MSEFIPGIVRREIDQSNVTVPLGNSTGAMVAFTKKGKSNTRTLVTNNKEFFDKFGTPSKGNATDNYYHAANIFLRESGRLWVVRATHGDEQYANMAFVSGGSVSNPTSADIQESSTTDILIEDGFEDGNTYNSIYAVEQTAFPEDCILTVSYTAPGSFGNNYGVSIITHESDPSLVDWAYSFDEPTEVSGVLVPNTAGDALWKQVYRINVYRKPENKPASWFQTNTSVSAIPVESWLVSNNPDLKDLAGSSLYAPRIINGNSDLIYVKVLDGFYPKDTSEVIALVSGKDSLQTASHTQVKKGWELFNDREKVAVNILIAPEEPSSDLAIGTIVEAADVAFRRKDCIAVGQVNPPNVTKVDKIVEGWNKAVWSLSGPSYFAPYVGYAIVYDPFTDKEVFLPNAIYGAALMARTDRIAEVWDSPAGETRGIISGTLGQKTVFNSSQISFLYENNLNTVKNTRVGSVMYGQKTAQRIKSALDRINVRRNLLFLENTAEDFLNGFVFEINDTDTRFRISSGLNDFLSGVRGRGGLYRFNVVCDETNNTPTDIDNNTIVVDIYVSPVKTGELIKFNTIVERSGVSLNRV